MMNKTLLIMGFIESISKRIALVTICVILGVGGIRSQNNTTTNILGSWKYVKHESWRVTQYSNKDINCVKKSVLIIDRNKVYFVGPASLLIEPCTYNKMSFKKFFDRDEPEPDVSEDRMLAVLYSKKELEKFVRIELHVDYNCLETMYLKKDTLILNYCGGVTFFLTRIKTNIDSHKSSSKMK